MSVKFSNNATTELASSIGTSDTSITVVDGSKFPILTAGDHTYVTLDTDTASPTREIVRVTAISGNVLTVTRGQDGTSPASFAAGTKVELRLTAALLNDVAGANPSGEPIGFPDKSQTTITFDSGIRTFSITPTGASFDVYCKGVKYTYTTVQLVTIPNTTGLHFIYFSALGVLSTQMSYFTWAEHAPTAYVYWNATTQQAVYFGDERHGITLDWQTHEYLHRTRGAAIANGFLASGYTLNSSATDAATQIAIESGTFFDEDMKIDVVSTATPTAGTHQQNLLFPAKIPVLHLQGTSWVMDAPTDFPFKQGTVRPQYNSLSGGVWSTTDVGNNQHATTWILATNNLTYPVIAIIGQSATDNQGEAEAFSFADLTLTGFPSVEFRPLYKLVYKASNGYANSVNAQLVSIVDLRSISAVGAAANPATDHGNLSGLSDDDHPQYVHTSEVRTPSAAVKNSFFPSQVGQTGKYLSTDGTNTVWEPAPSGSLSFTGDVTGSGSTGSSVAMTLAASGVVAGQYTKVTVDAKGRVTAGTGVTSADVTSALGYTPYNATNPAGYTTNVGTVTSVSGTGTVSGLTLTGSVTSSGSLTLGGTLSLTSEQVTTALGFTPYNATNPSGYITGITSGMVTTALGFTPYNATNPSGYISGNQTITVSGDASGSGATSIALTLANSGVAAGTYTKVTVDAKGRVTTGASLASGDLPTYTGTITSGQVTTALGFTPYNATNPSGYITGITSGMVTTALGYTPYNATNPSGYITSSASITGSAGSLSDTTNYFVNRGSVAAASIDSAIGLGVWNQSNVGDSHTLIVAGAGGSTSTVQQRFHYTGSMEFRNRTDSTNWQSWKTVLSNANYNSYSPTLTGTGASGTWGISISGNAATSTVMRYVGYAGDVGNLASAGTGIISNYNTSSAWTGAPSGMSYGSVYHLGGSTGGSILSLQIAADINHNSSSSTKQLWFRTSNNLGFQNDWKELLHSGNYNSYALPLSGGTLSGAITVTGGTNSIIAQDNGGSGDWRGRIISRNSTYDRAAFLGNYQGIAGVFAHNHALNAWADLYVNTVDGSGGGTVRMPSSVLVNGSQVLHAGNYTGFNGILRALGAGDGMDFNTSNYNSMYYGYIENSANKPTSYSYPYGTILTFDPAVGTAGRAQFYISHAGNDLTFRGGWGGNGSWQAWNKVLTNQNYTSYSPSLTGSGASGTWGINVTGSAGSLSNFVNQSGARYTTDVNSLLQTGFYNVEGTPSNSPVNYGQIIVAKGIDTGLQIAGGYLNDQLHFRGWASSGATMYAWRTVLHNGNYTSYSPSLTGSGASGTWGISITGNADTVDNLHASSFSRKDTTNQWIKPYYEYGQHLTSETPANLRDQMGGGGLRVDFLHPSYTGSGGWNHVITWSGYNLYNMYQLGGHYDGGTGTDLWVRSEANHGGTSWTAWRKLLNSSNYTSYSPSLTGSGASGSWGISITGAAASAGSANVMPSTGYGNGTFTWRQDSGTFAGQSGWASYLISNHGDGDTYYSQTIIMPFWSAPQYSRKQGSSAVVGPYIFLTTENYTSYSPSLTGSGASGSWNITAANATRASGNFYIDTNYGRGIIGLYSSYRYQGVFAMGDAYKLADDGTTTGNLYGIAWSHPNAGGAAGNLTDHGMLIINNGAFKCAISNSIVASGNITAYSDERLKKNWRDMPDNFVERLSQVRVGRYERIDDGMQQVGVSAQSLQPLLPEAIQVSNDEIKTLSVSYGNAALAAAVELAKELVMLKRELAEIKSRLH